MGRTGAYVAYIARILSIFIKLDFMNPETETVVAAPGLKESDTGYKVLSFLLEHGLSTEPVHYWVAHAFISNSHNELTTIMREQLQQHKPMDSYFLHDLYMQYISADSFRKFTDIGNDMRALLEGVLDSVQEADRSTSGFKETLQENMTLLHQVNNVGDIKLVARNLAEAVVTANASNASLKKSLEATRTEARALRNQLDRHRQEAIVDPLTGLYNRRGMQVEMERVLKHNVASDYAMLVIDIDHFKKINDTYGHSAGDAVIRKMGDTLRSLLPANAIAARFGGEEFVVLLTETRLEHATNVATDIRLSIERLRLVRRNDKTKEISFTVSIGVADSLQSDNMESLFERADHAMYQAKNSGRNRVEIAGG